jgi:hypothetical protein
MEQIPYELLDIMFCDNPVDLIRVAGVCKSWYEHIYSFPWELYMPFYTSWETPTVTDFNKMNMFTMLLKANKYKKYNLRSHSGLDNRSDRCRKNRYNKTVITTSLGVVYSLSFPNRIPVLKFKNSVDGQKDKWCSPLLNESGKARFMTSRWQLDTLTANKQNLKIKTVTLPKVVRQFILDGLVYRGRIYYGDNFAQTHDVLNYTGVLDYIFKDDVLTLLTDTYVYCLSLSTKVELSRRPIGGHGLRFFGFSATSGTSAAGGSGVSVCTLSLDGNITTESGQVYDKQYLRCIWSYPEHLGCWITYRERRVNLNKLMLDPNNSPWLQNIDSSHDRNPAGMIEHKLYSFIEDDTIKYIVRTVSQSLNVMRDQNK